MKVLKIACYVIMILFTMWFAISYIDIVADNTSMNPVHYSWNLFILMTGGAA